jgi:predicted helicase
MVYDHVARVIAPSFTGMPNSFPNNVQAGDSYTTSLTFTLPAEWDETKINIIGMILDPTGKIDNAGRATIAEAVANGYVGSTVDMPAIDLTHVMTVYPNPASTSTTVNLEIAKASNVSMRFVDFAGKVLSVKDFGSVSNEKMDWEILEPNEHGDWISLRNESFSKFFKLEPIKKFDSKTNSIFTLNSLGVGTSRDSWVYNFSKKKLLNNMKQTIDFYNNQVNEFISIKKENGQSVENFIDKDHRNISWSSSLIPKLEKGVFAEFNEDKVFKSTYRPFCSLNLYFGEHFIHRRGQYSQIYPTGEFTKNFTICVQQDAGEKMSPFIVQQIPDLELVHHAQCFPLYYYEENKEVQQGLFETDDTSAGSVSGKYVRRDGVSDYILDKATKQYNATNITKEDIFYYVYGFLHSPEYRKMFANDLKKMLPRLPLVEDVKDFWSFSKTGRQLAELHLNYESVPPFEGVKVEGEDSKFFKVEKMRFPKKDQKDTIHFNSQITISNIPKEAYEYVVNGKSAIEWIMERYQITTHKESQITNDPNDWAEEVGNPRYILDLLLSIINVSMQTRELVGKLPKVKFE